MFYSRVISVVATKRTAKRTTKASAQSSKAKSAKTTSTKATRRDDAEARKDRIIDVAIRLAAEGGFENVRQRDVAAQAGVALGTLYKSFRSKEDILSAALQRETDRLERRLERSPVQGAGAAERLGLFFQALTRTILTRPNYARAVLRAMTAGTEVATNVVMHQVQVTRMILAAMRDRPASEDEPPTEDELKVALLLQQIWFAAMVGWSAGLTDKAAVTDQVRNAAELLLAGVAAQASS
jgi:AcrR family transcriptional regulator